jgi:hypothetical protein
VDNVSYVDNDRSACLCGQGGGEYVACVLVAADGSHDLVLVDWELIGDGQHTYNRTTPEAIHEQAGPLPLDIVRRLAISSRGRRTIQRCGRPTKAGAPCRTPVARPGETCAWHRTPSITNERTGQ